MCIMSNEKEEEKAHGFLGITKLLSSVQLYGYKLTDVHIDNM
jgi:hypothetical protein